LAEAEELAASGALDPANVSGVRVVSLGEVQRRDESLER